MPQYSFTCENPRCTVDDLTLTLSASAVDELQFCPACAGILTRHYARDLRTVTLAKKQTAEAQHENHHHHHAPNNAHYKGEGEADHVHHPGCGCALAEDWHQKAAALTPDDLKRD